MVNRLLEVQKRLLQLQHGSIRQKRLEPKTDSQIIVPLSTIIRLLSVNHGICNWSQINRGGTDPLDNDQTKSRLVSDKIFTVKKASHRRRTSKSANDDFSEQLNRDELKMRRRRPPIDPMLLMVGIGRK